MQGSGDIMANTDPGRVVASAFDAPSASSGPGSHCRPELDRCYRVPVPVALGSLLGDEADTADSDLALSIPSRSAGLQPGLGGGARPAPRCCPVIPGLIEYRGWSLLAALADERDARRQAAARPLGPHDLADRARLRQLRRGRLGAGVLRSGADR